MSPSRAPNLLFRLYGVALSFFSLKTYVSCYQVQPDLLVTPGAWSLHALSLVALLMIWRGAHPLLLACATAFSARCLIATHRADEPLLWFPAAEWPIFIALPLFALVGGLLDRSRRDQLTLLSFRLSFLGAMGWAGLHKLNRDFFDPQVSCARLSERLTEWWGIPEWIYAKVSPAMIVSAELGVGLILLWRPRLGVVIATLMLGHFGTIGATALASVVVTMALSFLSLPDLDALSHLPRRRPLSSVCVFVSAMAVSYWAYQGTWSWLQYGLFHGLLSVVLLGLITLSWLNTPRADVERPPLGTRHRLFVALIISCWTLNGLTPYLGLKFQYSFAMLSNLRVDDHRWNSYLFSKRLRWGEHDGLIQVYEVMYRSMQTGRLLRGGPLKPGVYSPSSLRAYFKSAHQAREHILMRVRYRGEDHNMLYQQPQQVHRWLESLPDKILVQKKLTLHRPQRCVH